MKSQNLKKRLHVVWFLETERTRTLSVSLDRLLAAVVFMAVALLSIPLLAYKIHRQNVTLEQHRDYIRELKRLSVASLLDSENRGLDTALASAAETKLTLPETGAAQGGAALSASSTASVTTPKRLPMSFEEIELESTESGGTTVRFSLSAAPEAAGRSMAGRVCAIATLKSPAGQQRRIVTYPNDAANFVTKADCPRGLPVRFSRLRPTEVELPVLTEEILSIELRYTDEETSLTNKTTHKFD